MDDQTNSFLGVRRAEIDLGLNFWPTFLVIWFLFVLAVIPSIDTGFIVHLLFAFSMTGLASYAITPAPLPWQPPVLKTLCWAVGITFAGAAVVESGLIQGNSELVFAVIFFIMVYYFALVFVLFGIRRGLEYAIGYFND